MVDNNNALVPFDPNMARLNVTYGGQNGDYPDPIDVNSTDGDVRQFATEAVRNGGIPGIPADPTAEFDDFVVERYPATEELPPRLMLRPKTPFGVDVKSAIKSFLDLNLKCEVWEGAPGIWYVRTPEGPIWDMTIPQMQEERP